MQFADKSQLISIIIPCLDEQEVIPALIERLQAVQAELEKQKYKIELIFVDDGSKDETLSLLKEISIKTLDMRVLSLSRNFGHQLAITAGIDSAKGDAIILIDADLQDPPEVIPDMLAKWKEGYDVVYATRSSREGESLFKRGSASLFYRFLNKFSEFPIPVDTGDFRLMSREVVKVLRQMPEHNRFMRGMVSWVGMRQTSVFYKREKRTAGKSKYSFSKMICFALDGLLSFSVRPLRVAISMGMFSAFLGLCGIFYALYVRLLTNAWVEGWAGLFIAVLFMGGVQLITIGILGEYIGRIYNETKQRPLYVVRERLGFAEEED